MKKEAVRHFCNYLKTDHYLQFEDIDVDCIELYLDVTTDSKLIKKIIGTNLPKFTLILHTILSGDYNDELYRKEDDGIYAMRFKSPNSRIYCREIYGISSKKKIIMSRAIENKTSQRNNKTNLPIIKALKDYEFNYFEKYEDTETYKKREIKTK